MHASSFRAAAAALIFSGAAMVALALSASGVGEGGLAAQQLKLMSIALGAALLLASAARQQAPGDRGLPLET